MRKNHTQSLASYNSHNTKLWACYDTYMTTLYNVCAVHQGCAIQRGMFSTMGGIISTLGGIISTLGDIMSTLGDVQYTVGYHDIVINVGEGN